MRSLDIYVFYCFDVARVHHTFSICIHGRAWPSSSATPLNSSTTKSSPLGFHTKPWLWFCEGSSSEKQIKTHAYTLTVSKRKQTHIRFHAHLLDEGCQLSNEIQSCTDKLGETAAAVLHRHKLVTVPTRGGASTEEQQAREIVAYTLSPDRTSVRNR